MDLCSEPRLPLRPSWQCQVTFAAALITSKSGREATRFLSLFSKKALFPSRQSQRRRGGGLRPMFGRAVPADTCRRAGLHPVALTAALVTSILNRKAIQNLSKRTAKLSSRLITNCAGQRRDLFTLFISFLIWNCCNILQNCIRPTSKPLPFRKGLPSSAKRLTSSAVSRGSFVHPHAKLSLRNKRPSSAKRFARHINVPRQSPFHSGRGFLYSSSE